MEISIGARGARRLEMKIFAILVAYLFGLWGGWHLRRMVELRPDIRIWKLGLSDKPATNKDVDKLMKKLEK